MIIIRVMMTTIISISGGAAGGGAGRAREGAGRDPRVGGLAANNCTPEIDTSEITMDFQWHFPMESQW